ncbi:hypothetical protein [Acidihalobacter ferrooxydans]|uniref:hypothetical protein n=1 Tax=Acidihalobacter ferrooxydans TaxID=1765967 RepID=UPI0012EC786D|nr:hypothetical protein [Acidihalobacter ferrooxydans]
MKINVLDIVYCDFPFRNQQASKRRYGLVCEVIDGFHGVRYEIAYGTSKKVSRSGRRPTEFIVDQPEVMALLGLTKPTSFHLDYRVKLAEIDIFEVVGRIPNIPRLRKELYIAAEQAMKRSEG